MKLYYFSGLILISFTSAWAQTDSTLNFVLSDIEKIDSLIEVSLLGTLAGLSLASASLLISGRSQLERQRDDEDLRVISEQNIVIKKKLEDSIRALDIKGKYIQNGINYLVKSFFLFVANMISLLLFFDSFYDKSAFGEVQNKIIVFDFEVIPFLIGLIFLIVGAEYVRRAYTKQKIKRKKDTD
jgi:hypothetical protein